MTKKRKKTRRIGGDPTGKNATNRTAKGFRAMLSAFTKPTHIKRIDPTRSSVTSQGSKGVLTMIKTFSKGNSTPKTSIMKSIRKSKPIKPIKTKLNTIEESSNEENRSPPTKSPMKSPSASKKRREGHRRYNRSNGPNLSSIKRIERTLKNHLPREP
jgi:hypothetical protein